MAVLINRKRLCILLMMTIHLAMPSIMNEKVKMYLILTFKVLMKNFLLLLDISVAL